MFWQMFESLAPLVNPEPGDDDVSAELISTEAILKEQVWAFGVMCELRGVPFPDEMAFSYETWSASGTMTRCNEAFQLFTESRFIKVTGVDHVLDQETNRKILKYQCNICLGDDKENDFVIALPCKHMCHYRCITNWATTSNACPTCQSLIPARWFPSAASYVDASSSPSTLPTFQQLISKMGSYVRKLIN
ncbi:hypothetical protein Droror1_Dr00025810 [Drosera rotundifolia]